MNKKVIGKLDDCERNMNLSEFDKAKENLAEATNMVKQRQKVIRLADESELGWKVVDEYMQSEIASDEEDQKKIHRAQARARGKAKSERGRRGRRYMPYRSRAAHPGTDHVIPGISSQTTACTTAATAAKVVRMFPVRTGRALEGRLSDK